MPSEAARILSAAPYADQNSCAYGQRVLLDGIQSRASVAATLQTRHGALGGPHSARDVALRHARRGAGGDEVCYEELERVVFEQRASSPPVSAREPSVAAQARPVGDAARKNVTDGAS